MGSPIRPRQSCSIDAATPAKAGVQLTRANDSAGVCLLRNGSYSFRQVEPRPRPSPGKTILVRAEAQRTRKGGASGPSTALPHLPVGNRLRRRSAGHLCVLRASARNHFFRSIRFWRGPNRLSGDSIGSGWMSDPATPIPPPRRRSGSSYRTLSIAREFASPAMARTPSAWRNLGSGLRRGRGFWFAQRRRERGGGSLYGRLRPCPIRRQQTGFAGEARDIFCVLRASARHHFFRLKSTATTLLPSSTGLATGSSFSAESCGSGSPWGSSATWKPSSNCTSGSWKRVIAE